MPSKTVALPLMLDAALVLDTFVDEDDAPDEKLDVTDAITDDEMTVDMFEDDDVLTTELEALLTDFDPDPPPPQAVSVSNDVMRRKWVFME
ncbi:MAG: hypothetical protein EOO68_38785 [Moraxellaceae bacterium]|nr:MAG: hypothetical protein EOO68_38785 [Moraxellaceae bacterium]